MSEKQQIEQEPWNKNGLLNIKENDRILVVAPHADDETLGCGGLLLKYGPQTDVLLLSDGRFGYDRMDPDATPEKTRLLRQQEFKDVMAFLNVRKYTMMDLLNGDVYRYYSVVSKYDIREYDYIFVTSRFENSQDHLHAYYFLRKMIRAQHAKARLIEYEVWVPIPDPQVILDVSDVIERKKQALSLYFSQLKCYDYVNFACGLSMYRGGRFKRNNVEAFFVEPKHYYLKMTVRALTSYSFRQRMKKLFPFLSD